MDKSDLIIESGAQISAARALLGWTQQKLVDETSLSLPTIRRIEGAGSGLTGYTKNLLAIQQALETAGVEFIPENGGGAGVRLAKRGDK